ncbi:MAG: hypothetical protein M1834_007633 [Cirrosporium novae-zelandiae]|nr:MAG: hypothetical protein M1834_007633 [Cirrosporium novae-zelandiae]
MFPNILLLTLATVAVATAAAAATITNTNTTRHTTRVSLPSASLLSPQKLLPDAYGYSIEPTWAAAYCSSNLTSTLLTIISDTIGGVPPPIRIGGNSADYTWFKPDLNDGNGATYVAYPNASSATSLNVSARWYGMWGDYFPEGTKLLYTLNFGGDVDDGWANAIAEAEVAAKVLGNQLTLLEIGNEIDHYISEDYRAAGWDVAEYIVQWRNISDRILASDWYGALDSPPKFQAGVFADPPWVPDQQDEIDDFDIVNLTAAGLVDPDVIKGYSMHLYPQSTCDTERWYRMSLDLLSNHSVLWTNLSQYIPQATAATTTGGAPLVLGETNSVSCSGRSGISDTFGAALWSTDYVLMAASLGIEKVYFHLGAQSQYSAFTPLPYTYEGENLMRGIRANFYSHYFLAHVLDGARNLSVAAIPGANASDFSGYAIYSNDNDDEGQATSSSSEPTLQKLVFLNMGIWNSTHGLHNPSTLSSTDSTSSMPGVRPNQTIEIQSTGWAPGTELRVVRLEGPGTNAKSGVSVSGVGFDMESGERVGVERMERVVVGEGGRVGVLLRVAEGVLLVRM